MKQKESLTSNLTFIALMSAFNIIFAALMLFLPALSLILYLLLPFITTIVILFCKTKYTPIYFIASIAISFIINLNGLEYIIFTLLPSLITGTIFGICIKKKVNIGLTILISSFCQFLFSIMTLPLINVIYTNNRNILDVFASFLGEEKKHLTYKLFLPLTLVVALTQNIISFLIISSEITKFNVELNESNHHYIAYSYLNIFLIVLTLISIWLFDDYMFLLLSLSIIIFTLSLFSFDLLKNKWFIICEIIVCVITFISFVLLSQYSLTLYIPLILDFPILAFTMFDIIYNLFKNNKVNVKIIK
ncbi:MAG: hypothetical protein J1F32_02370 [Erysipelotrichales bacterium]|nr:hypothetical protein [Erysipelotrichales bacterium]